MENNELTKDVKCICIKISLLIKLLTKKDVSQNTWISQQPPTLI